MAYKCRICGSNEVEHQGDVCELCAIGQDPYAASMSGSGSRSIPIHGTNSTASNSGSYVPKRGSNRKVLLNGGAAVANNDPYGNDMTPAQGATPPVQVYAAGQTPSRSANAINGTKNKNNAQPVVPGNQPLSTGIVKNVTVDNQKKSILEKWFRALSKGAAFSISDDVTSFQVYPDYSGTALNAQGYACDQVIVYGKLNNGVVCENNDVEVYGRRDHTNMIIAQKIRNKASGTTIMPQGSIGAGAVWTITIIALLSILAAVFLLGPVGIAWTVILILCLTNFPVVVKIFGVITGAIYSFIKLFK